MEILETLGGEFFTFTGEEYKGKYILENNIAYIYQPLTKEKQKLIPRFMHNTELIRSRSKHKGGYKAPTTYVPVPTEVDYANGIIKRYFMQKRTSPKNTITEVSKTDYSRYGPADNYNRINSRIYNAVEIEWAIAGAEKYVRHFNIEQIKKVVRNFPGLDWYLINHKEFLRKF